MFAVTNSIWKGQSAWPDCSSPGGPRILSSQLASLPSTAFGIGMAESVAAPVNPKRTSSQREAISASPVSITARMEWSIAAAEGLLSSGPMLIA